MKQNDIKDKNILKLDPQHIENLFNVYTNEDGQYYYNLLKTVYFPNELDPTIYVEYETVRDLEEMTIGSLYPYYGLGSYQYQGFIALIAVFNDALTEQEVNESFNWINDEYGI